MNKTLKSCLAFMIALCVSIPSISTFTKGVEKATNDTVDSPQANRARIVVTHTVDGGPGSLRQAIIDAEADPGNDTITFNIPTSDRGYNSATNSWTITPLNSFPELSSGQTIIDATTQPGFNARPVIEINASSIRTSDLFLIRSTNNIIRGLAINRFNGTPGQHAVIRIVDSTATDNCIEGCFFGTDITGTKVLKNATINIVVSIGGSRNIIGGRTEAQRNIISGCNDVSRGSVQIQNPTATDNAVIGNYIGLDVTGTVPLGNAGDGVLIVAGAKNNLIVGNVIAASGSHGIAIYTAVSGQAVDTNGEFNSLAADPAAIDEEQAVFVQKTNHRNTDKVSASSGNKIIGNFIGTKKDGSGFGVGNKLAGIGIFGNSPHNTIGGISTGEGNVIAYNGREGILISDSASVGNTIRGNSISGNEGLGINNIYQGNTELESPIIRKLLRGNNGTVAGTTVVDGVVDLYSDFGDEGRSYLGSTTAVNGNFVFIGNIPESSSSNIAATLTDTSGNTSEFARLDLDHPYVEILSPPYAGVVPARGFPIEISFHDRLFDRYFPSGIDSSSFRIYNNRKIGTIGKFIEANTDLSKFFQIADNRMFFLVPNDLEFPLGENEIRASIRDNVGNRSNIASRLFTASAVGLYQNPNPFSSFGSTQNPRIIYSPISPVNLKGFAIEAYVGAIKINDNFVDISNDRFETSLPLNTGSNIVNLIAYDHVMNFIERQEYIMIYDKNPPRISLSAPQGGSTFQHTPIKVTGTVKDENQIEVIVESLYRSLPLVDSLGRFETEVEINEKDAAIAISATDKAGNRADTTINVFGIPPSSPKGRLILFLKPGGILSKFPMPPGNGYRLSFQSVATWDYVLPGDIKGNEYQVSLLLSSLQGEITHLEAELLVSCLGKEFTLAKTPALIEGPSLGPSKVSFALKGIDAETHKGDLLILRLRKLNASQFGTVWLSSSRDTSTIAIPAVDEASVAVDDKTDVLPSEYVLSQNYPNPFNPETKINYQLPKTSEVKLEIFNLIGQRVITLVDQKQPAGYYTVPWNGRNRLGQPVASGIYFYRIKAGTFVMVKKLMVLR